MSVTQLNTTQYGDNTVRLAAPNQDVVGILPTANGGTGLAAAGTAGNVLTSNGTSWQSSPASGGSTGFSADGGASNTSYVGVLKVDFGGSL